MKLANSAESLRCHQVAKTYSSPRGNIVALDGVTFQVGAGQFVAVVGPSGCGKSTLLRLIAGLFEPTGGAIDFPGWSTPPKRAMVFQEQGLFPWMTALDNAAFGLEMQGASQRERRRQAQQMLDLMGVGKFAANYPHELSGGMRQRVGIARAFVSNPEILLMDEPFRALDAQTRLVLQEELLRIWEEHQKMVIYVTHDIEEALLMADRVLVMSGQPGSIREEIRPPYGRPRDLTGRVHPEVEDLKWHVWNLLEPEVRQKLRPPGS